MNYCQELNHYFQDLSATDLFSGVVLITQGEQNLYSGAFGLASRVWKIPNRLDTRFDTASITKLFTAAAVLQMIEQGEFGFDTGVIEYLGLQETRILPEVNVYHLLTHTSGIGDDVEEENGERYEDLWKTHANYLVTKTADFLPNFIDKPHNFLPGDSCRYCNCSYVLLGLMVEKAAGINFRDYILQHVFIPAGMNNSNFFWMDQVNENVAEGADPIKNDDEIVGWKRNIYSFPPVGSPDAGAHVTAGDLDRFLRSMKDGRLVSQTLSDAFFTPQVHYREYEDWKMFYGYGMWFYVDRQGAVVCCQKEGINAGVSGMVRYFPKNDINVIILANMEEAAWKPIWHIHEMVTADVIIG